MNPSFDPRAMLSPARLPRRAAEFEIADSIFSQGDAANSVMYVQKGALARRRISRRDAK